MAAHLALPKNQHYVPQFLLRHFAAGKKPQLYVFDKRTGKSFRTAVKNAAAERGYYNLPVSEASAFWRAAARGRVENPLGDVATISFEPVLAQLESRASKAIERILREESIANLTDGDRAVLGHFSAVQVVRSPQQRDLISQIRDGFRTAVLERADGDSIDPAELNRLGLAPHTADELVAEHLRQLTNAASYAPLFMSKHWILVKAPDGHTFYIGDNPITLHDNTPQDERLPFAGVGLGTPGVEIAFPLSARMCLVMLSQDTVELIRDTRRKRHLLARAGVDIKIPTSATELFDAVETRATLSLVSDNVVHLNSRQILHASRFLYSIDGRFGLAQSMIEEDPMARRGLTIQVE